MRKYCFCNGTETSTYGQALGHVEGWSGTFIPYFHAPNHAYWHKEYYSLIQVFALSNSLLLKTFTWTGIMNLNTLTESFIQ